MKQLNFAGRTLLSFVTFYLGWWACALGASYGYPWIGPLLVPIWVALHIYFSPTRLGEFYFCIAIAAAGFFIDTILIWLNVFTIEPVTDLAPVWLVGMWVLWGLSFESMLMLRSRFWMMFVMGAISGPLTYYACEALNILFFVRPLWMSVGIHGLLWGLLIPGLFLVRDLCMRLALLGGGFARH